jgi:transcriptional regulator GlxA family with amidase domain
VARWGNVSLDGLIHQTGLGVRQFERRFLDGVGLRPKLLARICRFQGVLQALEAGPGRWAGVAADCGYYDASHLIRDFRELAGDPPSRIVEQAQLLTGVFTRAGRTTDSSNTSG